MLFRGELRGQFARLRRTRHEGKSGQREERREKVVVATVTLFDVTDGKLR